MVESEIEVDSKCKERTNSKDLLVFISFSQKRESGKLGWWTSRKNNEQNVQVLILKVVFVEMILTSTAT